MSLKKVVLLCAIVGVAAFQTLNFSGFCYSESRWLEPEQIEHRLAWHGWREMDAVPSDDEIEQQAKQSHLYGCQKVSRGPGNFLYRLVGAYRFNRSILCKEDPKVRTDERYASEGYGDTDACGRPLESYKMGLTKQEYLKKLKHFSVEGA